MAVAFMAKLEKNPESYEKKFDEVVDGRLRNIHNMILERIKPGMRFLDLGCGPGRLAIEASKRGAEVVAIDANELMIYTALDRAEGLENPPRFIHQDLLQLIDANQSELPLTEKFDFIASTFVLSELKPSQRHLFLKIVRERLTDDGVFAIASETLPKKRSARRNFWKNREQAAKESGRIFPYPVEDLSEIVRTSGLGIKFTVPFGPEMTFVLGEKSSGETVNAHNNLERNYHGTRARGRIWYNHLTGSWRGMPIEPGLYKVGNPDRDSPVIVTANYELTYYTVMRSLARDDIDAWVLVCDSAGINVWCAARGRHFHTDEVVHMVHLTDLQDIVDHRELILPQLAAAGMEPSDIKERTGFRVRYGPVRIHDLKQWMNLKKPRPKPREMASVTFNLKERMEMTVAHIPFLFAALLWIPFALLLGGLLGINLLSLLFLTSFAQDVWMISQSLLVLILQFVVALLGNAVVLGLTFPILPSKGNSFWRRGLGFAALTLPMAFVIMWSLGTVWTLIVTWMVVQFILSITLTMDFAGMTPVSDPKVIRDEYPYMILTLLIGAMFIIGFNSIAYIFGW